LRDWVRDSSSTPSAARGRCWGWGRSGRRGERYLSSIREYIVIVHGKDGVVISDAKRSIEIGIGRLGKVIRLPEFEGEIVGRIAYGASVHRIFLDEGVGVR